MSQRHQAMAGIMKDLVVEMTRMQEQMGAGEPTPEMRKQMALNMRRMSEMMQRMSGLTEYANMSKPEFHRQLEEMRRQMDEMLQAHRASYTGKAK